MHDNLIWIRGEIIPQSQATVNVLSPMAQFGLNVFEGIRCYRNDERGALYAFRLSEHLDRLMQSCRLLRLDPPFTPQQIEGWLKDVLSANDFQTDVAVRATIFVDGEGTWNSSDPVSMFIAPIARPRTDIARMPAYKATVSSWQRINDNVLPPRAKVGANYVTGRYAFLQARQDGYDLPIFLGTDGKVAESSGACLFMLRGGKLITPPITSSILESITRDTVMALARDLGFDVQERPIDRTELYVADEVFLAGSAAEISPIVSVDGFVLDDGRPGPLTTRLLVRYHDLVSGADPESYPHWRTLVHSSQNDSRSNRGPET